MEKTMTDKKLNRIVDQLGFILLLMDVIEIEIQHDIHGYKFADSLLNNHVRRMKESAAQIRNSIHRKIKISNKEEAFYDYAIHFHQLIKHFKEKDGATIEELVNSLEAYEKNKQQELLLHS